MSSEPAESHRPGRPSARPPSRADKAETKKAQVTDELRAMMRDVPVSERLMKVLDDLETLAEQDEAKETGESQDPPKNP